MMGAWGPASFSGRLVQLRALDWDTDGPFQQWPVLTVFHPSAATGGVPHATLGWAGMLGAITGVSSAGIGISEKVWDAYKGQDNMYGYAWNFLLAGQSGARVEGAGGARIMSNLAPPPIPPPPPPPPLAAQTP